MAIQAILFDVYGTLLDVHSAVAQAGRGLGARAEPISRLWRQKQLEYTWVYSLRGEYRSFRSLTESSLDFALAAHGIADSGLRAALLGAYERLDPYPEVCAALLELQRRDYRLAPLSNGDPDMLETGLRSAGLLDRFDAVLSVAPLRTYKPDRRVYELGQEWAGRSADEIAFVSSNAWDAAGAAAFGFRTFWIDRTGQPAEYEIAAHCRTVASLTELASALA